MTKAMRWTIAVLLSTLTLAATGCGGTCSRLDDAAHNCGDSFDRTSCDNNIHTCSSDDLKTLNNLADCLENEAVCKDKKTVDVGKKFACELSGASVSNSCKFN